MNNEFEVLVYQVGKQDMAFDVEYVGMVIEKPEITPNTAPSLESPKP